MDWTRRRVVACALGVGGAALAGCLDDGSSRSLPERPTGTWGQFAHDAGNTGVAEVTVPDRGTLAWENGNAETIPPLVADDTVFSVADELVALDAQTGETRWRVDLDTESTEVATPAVTDDAVIVGVSGRVVAFERDGGDELWEQSIDGIPRGPTTVDTDQTVAVVPFRYRRDEPPLGGLSVVATDTGDVEWTAQLRVSPFLAPAAIRDGRVYAAGRREDDTSVLRGYSLEDGSQAWERELTEAETPPTVTSSGVFISDAGQFRRYDHAGENPQTLLDHTETATTAEEIRAVAVGEETAFVLSRGGLFAISVADGSRRWHTSVEPLADGISVGNEAVVVSVRSDEFDTQWPCVAAFDRADGSTRWYHSVGESFDPTLGRTAIADGAVYFKSNTVDGIAALGDLPPED